MTNKEIKETINADTISCKNKIDVYNESYKEYTARWQFFYTMDRSAEKYAEKIKELFPTAKIIETTQHNKAFRGGASVANSSHFLVRFTI